MKFLCFKYYGHLPEDAPVPNEAQFKYDAFFCFRFVNNFSFGLHLVKNYTLNISVTEKFDDSLL